MTAFAKKYYRSLAPLLKGTDYPSPVDWAAVFGRSAPLELEIGFGNGEYLNKLSLERPEHDFIGLEVAWSSLKRALRRLADPPRPNARVLLLDGRTGLSRLFAPRSLAVIRSLFPMPWTAEGQAHRRLFQRGFLNLAASRLRDDGLFIMVTDSLELARWTMAQAEATPLALALAEAGAGCDTKYERKWQEGGQHVFYHLTGRKVFHPPVAETEDTPLQSYLTDHFDPHAYAPQGCADDVVVKFKDFLFDEAKGEGLLRAFVLEGSLTQEFFIKIARDGGRWKFSPAIPSQLFPTRGVGRALELASGGRPAA